MPGSVFPDSQDPAAWTRLLLDAARSHLRANEPAAACECAERAAEIATAAVPEVTILSLSILADAREAAGQRDQAREVLADAANRELLAGNELAAADFERRIGSLHRSDADFRAARTHLLRSLQLSSRYPPGPSRAAALEDLGPVERQLGLSSEALEHLEEAVRIREALSDRLKVASGNDRIGNIHLHLGQLDQAEERYARSLRIYEELGDKNGTAVVSNNLGSVQIQRGHYEEALRSLERARMLASEVGDSRALAWATGNLGLAHAYLGNTGEAEPALLACIAALAERGDRTGQAIFANNLALVYLTSARYEESIAWGERSVAQMKELGQIESATKPWLNVARANLELGRIDEAEKAAAEVRRLAETMESVEIKSEERILEAALALARSEWARARTLAHEAILQASSLPRQRAVGLRLLGEADYRSGDFESAREALSESESLFVHLGDVYDLALVRLELGRLFLQAEAHEAAALRLRQAQEVFARLGHAPLLCRSWLCLAEVEAARGGSEIEGHLERARTAARGAGRDDLLAEVEAVRMRIEDGACWEPEDSAGGLSAREQSALLELIEGLRVHGPGEGWLAILGGTLGLDGALLGSGDASVSPATWGDAHELVERWQERLDPRMALRSAAVERLRSGPRELVLLRIPGGNAGAQESQGSKDEIPGEVGGLLAVLRSPGQSFDTVPGSGGAPGPRAGASHTGATLLPEAGVRTELLLPIVAAVLGLPAAPPARESGMIALPPPASFEGLIGESSEMRAIYRTIERVAPSDASVLLLGESGTGKELVARAIHERSGRQGKPFVAISCPSIPRELIEAELFGHEKGAFTGATSERRGQIEAADGGTLFLDEIGDMDLATQTKLLRFLQEREFLRVGGREPIRVDIRVLAATSRDLDAEIAAGRFRLDLYYRIGVVPLRLPPLRERIQDVPTLVGHFLATILRRGAPLTFDRGVFDALASYSWPGNVRELRNVVEYVLAMYAGEGPVTVADLPARVREAMVGPDGGLPLALRRGETLEARLLSVEGAILRRTLESCGWNQTRAARRLGLKESTMRYKMRRFDLHKPGTKREERRHAGERPASREIIRGRVRPDAARRPRRNERFDDWTGRDRGMGETA